MATRQEMVSFITRHTFEMGWNGDFTGDTWCEVKILTDSNECRYEDMPTLFELQGYSGNRDGGPWAETVEERLERADDAQILRWFQRVGHEIHGISA